MGTHELGQGHAGRGMSEHRAHSGHGDVVDPSAVDRGGLSKSPPARERTPLAGFRSARLLVAHHGRGPQRASTSSAVPHRRCPPGRRSARKHRKHRCMSARLCMEEEQGPRSCMILESIVASTGALDRGPGGRGVESTGLFSVGGLRAHHYPLWATPIVALCRRLQSRCLDTCVAGPGLSQYTLAIAQITLGLGGERCPHCLGTSCCNGAHLQYTVAERDL